MFRVKINARRSPPRGCFFRFLTVTITGRSTSVTIDEQNNIIAYDTTSTLTSSVGVAIALFILPSGSHRRAGVIGFLFFFFLFN